MAAHRPAGCRATRSSTCGSQLLQANTPFSLSLPTKCFYDPTRAGDAPQQNGETRWRRVEMDHFKSPALLLGPQLFLLRLFSRHRRLLLPQRIGLSQQTGFFSRDSLIVSDTLKGLFHCPELAQPIAHCWGTDRNAQSQQSPGFGPSPACHLMRPHRVQAGFFFFQLMTQSD